MISNCENRRRLFVAVVLVLHFSDELKDLVPLLFLLKKSLKEQQISSKAQNKTSKLSKVLKVETGGCKSSLPRCAFKANRSSAMQGFGDLMEACIYLNKTPQHVHPVEKRPNPCRRPRPLKHKRREINIISSANKRDFTSALSAPAAHREEPPSPWLPRPRCCLFRRRREPRGLELVPGSASGQRPHRRRRPQRERCSSAPGRPGRGEPWVRGQAPSRPLRCGWPCPWAPQTAGRSLCSLTRYR